MRMISRTGTHTLRALVLLEGLPRGNYAGAAQVAREIRAPSNYLGKILRELARSGIVEGRKGSKGGFRLARDSRSISLFDALERIEHFDRLSRCILGRPKCSNSSPCLAHQGWSRARDTYLDFLKATTLSELVEKSPIKGRRKSGPNERAAQIPRATAIRSAAGGVR
jgi:Rrf2 family transcriptional regulator, iron-sulfur cluster assembly transcription factor